MSPYPEPLYGQCKCGAALTVDHIRNHCPLRPQRAFEEERLSEAVRVVFEARLDTTHAAVLGEN